MKTKTQRETSYILGMCFDNTFFDDISTTSLFGAASQQLPNYDVIGKC